MVIGNGVVASGFVIAWSSGFIGARIGTESASSLTLLMWRFALVGTVLGAWLLVTRRYALTPREAALQAGIGLLSQGGYLFGVVTAIDLGVSPGTAALAAAMQPLLAAALARPVLGEPVSARQWTGLAAGLAGVALVVRGEMGVDSGTPPWAYLLPFAGMASLVAATLIERKARLSTPLATALPVQFLVSTVLFTSLAAATGNAAPPAAGGFWFAVAWTIVFSTIGGYGFYWMNVRRSSLARVSSLLYLTPPVTLVWAYVMFGDPVPRAALAGIAICCAAVLAVLMPRRRAQVSHV